MYLPDDGLTSATSKTSTTMYNIFILNTVWLWDHYVYQEATSIYKWLVTKAKEKFNCLRDRTMPKQTSN